MLFEQDEVFWYLNRHNRQPLAAQIRTDVAIIGAGMAGLSAAQAFRNAGLEVVVLEKNYCGAGASGKSSGFITPNSELSLKDLNHAYGTAQALQLWNFAVSGVTYIHETIKRYALECDYLKQDTLVVATSERAFEEELLKEYELREHYNLPSILFSSHDLPLVLGSSHYAGGISYSGSFSINGYKYCNGLAHALERQGIIIYEDSPVIEISGNKVITAQGQVTADYIIVCLDHFVRNLGKLMDQVYHVQTFLLLSQVLSEHQLRKLFPQKSYMTWDTELIYNYFRLTTDNRLLIGGASLFYTYAKYAKHNSVHVMHKMSRYMQHYFPELEIIFEYMWPGLIGVSKDLLPVAGQDANNSAVYYISAAAGLPWAAALGHYCKEHVLQGRNDLDRFFSPYRNFTLGPITQKILGTQLTFALSHLLRVKSL